MTNPYIEGNFAPIGVEHTITDLAVTGVIPAHLDGRYLRNGPNPVSAIDPATYHWFIGDGMVHGIRLRDGKAEWYRNRWVRSPGVSRALGESDRWPTGLETIGVNTNVIGHAGRTLALIEGGASAYELTEELDTVGPCDFDGTVPGGYTAHPKRDPGTGELHAMSYFFGWGNMVRYSVIDTAGRVRHNVDIEVTGSPMMHDFSLTENHVVLYDLPVTFDPRKAAELVAPRYLRGATRLMLSALVGRVRVPDPVSAAGMRGSSAGLPYGWNPKYPARIGVMPRDGTNADVRWFDIEPCYVFHPLNAYDDGDTIVLDVVRHPKIFDRDDFDQYPGTLDRWTVDLNAGKITEARLDDRGQEFPRVDERLVGRRHRYGYGVTFGSGGSDTVLKHDLVTGATATRSFGAGSQVSEFVFEPGSPDAGEDDGVLMGFVYQADTDRSDLVLLDAGSLDIAARVHLPDRVPQGFHGNWVPA